MKKIKEFFVRLLQWLGILKKEDPKSSPVVVTTSQPVCKYKYEIRGVSFSYQNPIPKTGGTLMPDVSVSAIDRYLINEDGSIGKRETVNANIFSRGFKLIEGDGFVLNASNGMILASENVGHDIRRAFVRLSVSVEDAHEEVKAEVIQL